MRYLTMMALLLLVAVPAVAQTQRTETCVDGIADVYRFRPAAFTQNEIRVMAGRNNPGLFFIVFDADADVQGVSFSNSRSVHWSAGMLSGNHDVWVGCLRNASYTIQWVSGNEKRLGPPRYIEFLRGSDAGAKLGPVEIADVRVERLLRMARSRQSAAER